MFRGAPTKRISLSKQIVKERHVRDQEAQNLPPIELRPRSSRVPTPLRTSRSDSRDSDASARQSKIIEDLKHKNRILSQQLRDQKQDYEELDQRYKESLQVDTKKKTKPKPVVPPLPLARKVHHSDVGTNTFVPWPIYVEPADGGRTKAELIELRERDARHLATQASLEASLKKHKKDMCSFEAQLQMKCSELGQVNAEVTRRDSKIQKLVDQLRQKELAVSTLQYDLEKAEQRLKECQAHAEQQKCEPTDETLLVAKLNSMLDVKDGQINCFLLENKKCKQALEKMAKELAESKRKEKASAAAAAASVAVTSDANIQTDADNPAVVRETAQILKKLFEAEVKAMASKHHLLDLMKLTTISDLESKNREMSIRMDGFKDKIAVLSFSVKAGDENATNDALTAMKLKQARKKHLDSADAKMKKALKEHEQNSADGKQMSFLSGERLKEMSAKSDAKYKEAMRARVDRMQEMLSPPPEHYSAGRFDDIEDYHVRG